MLRFIGLLITIVVLGVLVVTSVVIPMLEVWRDREIIDRSPRRRQV